MRHPTRARRDVLADGGADQRMKELKRPHRREDLRPREPIRGQLGKLRIKLGEPRPEHGLGAGAEHRDRHARATASAPIRPSLASAEVPTAAGAIECMLTRSQREQ